MRNYESVGMVIGAIIGAVLTGLVVYFTKSAYAAVLGLFCMLFGGWIGRSFPQKKNEN